MNTLPQLFASTIKRVSVSHAVAENLQALIARERLQAGARLPSERELAEALGVGRPAIREGVRLLQGLGVIEVVHGKGIYLRDAQLQPITDLANRPSADKLVLLLQVTHARRLVDVEAARAAAAGLLPGARERLHDYLRRCQEEPLRTRRRFGLDLGFEQALCEATGNQYLIALQRVAHQMFIQAWQTAGFIPRPADERHAQHEEILAAVLDCEVERASELMAAHVSFQVNSEENKQ